VVCTWEDPGWVEVYRLLSKGEKGQRVLGGNGCIQTMHAVQVLCWQFKVEWYWLEILGQSGYWDGMTSEFNNTLNNFVSEGAILDAVNLGILPEIPSWPLALVSSSAFRCHTSCAQSIAHIIRTERVGWMTLSDWTMQMVAEGIAVLGLSLTVSIGTLGLSNYCKAKHSTVQLWVSLNWPQWWDTIMHLNQVKKFVLPAPLVLTQ